MSPGETSTFPFDVARKNGKPVLGPDGEPLCDPYYLLNVTTRFDAILVHRSPVGPPHESGVVFPKTLRMHELVFDKSLVDGFHVWEGIKHMPGTVMISNTLGDWIIAEKMKGAELTKLREE